MTEKTKSWFDCLNAVAIELEADKSFSAQTTLIRVMEGAGITLEEVREAQEMGYAGLNESSILIDYEGLVMSKEEEGERFD